MARTLWKLTKNFPDSPLYNNFDEGEQVDESTLVHKFRILDDDGEVYCEGITNNSSTFKPLDFLTPLYGCTDIQYWEDGQWQSL